MSKIEKLFYEYEQRHQGGIIVEIPLLEPIPNKQIEVCDLLVKAGIDVIQVTVPYRFPWMQGSRIQSLLKNNAVSGVDYHQSFEVFKLLTSKYPKQIFTTVGFYGGVKKMGMDKYLEEAKKLGIDTIDVPDYPLVHDGDPFGFYQKMRSMDMNYVNCISTDLALAEEGSKAYADFEKVVLNSHSFCFLIATKGGKTGEVDEFPYDKLLEAKTAIKKIQDKHGIYCPIVAVCGISKPEQVRIMTQELGLHVMFGSALFTRLVNGVPNEEILQFLKEMKAATLPEED